MNSVEFKININSIILYLYKFQIQLLALIKQFSPNQVAKMIQQNLIANLDVLEVEHYINKYQTMLTQLEKEKDALHELFMEVQTLQQFNRAKQSIKEKFNQSMLQFKDSVNILVHLSQCYIDKQQQNKNLKLIYENTIAQQIAQIESQKEQIAYLKEKVKSSDQQVDKLTLQLTSLQENVESIDNYFEKQKNKHENFIQKQQISQQKSRDQFISQLKQSNRSLSNTLRLTKKQKSQHESISRQLNSQIYVLQNKLSNLQGKYQYQIRKKQDLQQKLADRLKMIDQMQKQINHLSNIFTNPYQLIQPEEWEEQLQFVSEQANHDQHNKEQSSQNNSLAKNLNQIKGYIDVSSVFQSSYIYQRGSKLENPQKHANDDYQKHSSENQSGQEFSVSMRKMSIHGQVEQIQQKSKNAIAIQKQKLDLDKQDKQQVLESQEIEKSPSERSANNRKSFEQKINKSNLIGNTRKNSDSKSFGQKQNRQNALQNIKTSNMKKGQQNVTTITRSYLKGKAGIDKKGSIQMDPYFSHYVLTSQSVKIRQGIQDLFSIDVKPFYKEIIDKRIPMHQWDQWIRNKLREVWKERKEKS